jgi:hypothetical protein
MTDEKGKKNRAPDESQVDHQTARIAYANWPRRVFHILQGTANEVRMAALARIDVGLWPWRMTEASTVLESIDTTLMNPGPRASGGIAGKLTTRERSRLSGRPWGIGWE